MSDEPNEFQTRVALFRYGMITDLVQLPKKTARLQKKLQKKTERDYEIPKSLRTRVTAKTMQK